MKRVLGVVALVLGSGAVLGGCAGRTSVEAAKHLSAQSVSERRDAAEDIEDEAEDGADLPREVVDALLYSAASETDFETRASVVRSLGWSGDVRAKEVLDAYARGSATGDDQRHVASFALQKWAVKSGRYPADHKFPANWPYGTETYPGAVPGTVVSEPAASVVPPPVVAPAPVGPPSSGEVGATPAVTPPPVAPASPSAAPANVAQ